MASRSRDAAAAAAGAAARLLDGGKLLLVDAADRVIAELGFASPAFAVTGGTAIANPLEPGIARTTGQPVTFRAVRADGSPMFSGLVGTDLILDRPRIEAGSTVRASSFVYIEASESR